jgi:uncharacterized membrane protein HdeD (DUF308 family)
MKYLKKVSLIFTLAGVISIIIASIWAFTDPGSWSVLAPFFIGALLLLIGLLCLIVFYIGSLVSKRQGKERQYRE